MTSGKKPTDTQVASPKQQNHNEWVKARPVDDQRNAAIQASVTSEEALLDAYPGSAESLATLAATLGIAWTVVEHYDSDD